MEIINKYRSSIVMGLLILFLLLFAFYMLAIRPVSQDLEEQRQEAALLEQEGAMLETKVNELRISSENMTSGEEALLAAIPQGDAAEELIRDLKSIGSESYARLKDLSFSLPDTASVASLPGLSGQLAAGLKEIKMSAIVEGGYLEIHEWLKLLNEQERILSVDSFSFQQPYEFPTPQKPGSILTANVSFTAFYQELVQPGESDQSMETE